MRSTGRSVLAALLAEQRHLEVRIHELESDPRQVLDVGSSLLAFAGREHQAFDTLAPLLDPAVEAELSGEHQQFAEDLDLLQWLLQTTPDSPDVGILTNSLIRRMRQHVDRDGRLLSRASVLRTSRNRRGRSRRR